MSTCGWIYEPADNITVHAVAKKHVFKISKSEALLEAMNEQVTLTWPQKSEILSLTSLHKGIVTSV